MSQFNPPSTPPLSKVATSKVKRPFYKRKLFIALLVFPALWIIGTLAPQDAETKTESGNSSNASNASTASTASVNVECVAIPSVVLADIASGEESGVGMTPVVGYAVKSPDFSNVYFLAIQFSAAGIDDQIGVWARNGIDSGIIMAVDSIAQNFTVWPDADGTDAAIASNDPSVSSAKSCL
jgi:hypothetical protein